MVELQCPWCEEAALLPFLEVERAEAFTCGRCGTTVEFVEEPASLDLAA